MEVHYCMGRYSRDRAEKNYWQAWIIVGSVAFSQYKLSVDRAPVLLAKPLLKAGMSPDQVMDIRTRLQTAWEEWRMVQLVTKGARL